MVANVKPVMEKAQNGAKEIQKPMFEIARKIVLASIGAVGLAQDEIEEFVKRLIERGEIAEKDGRKLLKEVQARRKKGAEKAEDEITKRVEEILDTMNVPKKSDIEVLGDKIAALSKKVDELKKKPVA